MKRAAWLVALASTGCADILGVESLSGIDAGIDASDAAADAAAAADASPECSLAWIDAGGGAVPSGAVASEKSDGGVVIYVCRAKSGSDLVPGKLLPAWYCYYSDGQGEPHADPYEVLVPSGCAVAWGAAPGGIAPPAAVVCGHDSQGALYACKVGPSGMYPNELGHMGLGTNHECVYSYGGASLSTGDFTVLTAK